MARKGLVSFVVYCTAEEKEALRASASANGQSLGQYVREVLRMRVGEEGRREVIRPTVPSPPDLSGLSRKERQARHLSRATSR